ncbi:MAG: hypothetical protein S4CHLAM45_06540 [Chlamydiales bacterium]|nr:hypothetical protein [Chlamydiales bacterium]MCH9620323.1 hypothetical protein [Chlamydiales bacterium]MCH9622766.1 hypothetical protein [Chlamydiales bacterium]
MNCIRQMATKVPIGFFPGGPGADSSYFRSLIDLLNLPGHVWSHETALDIYEITDVMPVKMHMTVPKGFRRNQAIPKVLVLHHQDLSEDNLEIRQGYRVTKPLRTLIDVVNDGSISLDQVKLGVRQAIKQGLISKRDIQKNESANILLKYIDDDTV